MSNSGTVRTRWAAVGAAAAITLGAAGIGGLNIADADISSGDRPAFVSINPCRLVDTRPGDLTVGPRSTPIGAGETLTVTAHGTNGECTSSSTIPTDALSLSLNVTAVGPTSNTFLTFWGGGANPGTSNLNPRAGGAPTPNSVNTPLSSAGTFNIFNNKGSVNVIVDVNGYYANHNHDDLYAQLDHDHDETYVEQPIEFIIDGYAFRPDGEPTDWDYGNTWDHVIDTGNDCLVADVDIPAGATINSVDLIYGADAPAYVEMTLASRTSGPASSGDLPVLHAQYDADVPATPPMVAGVQALTLAPGGTQIPAEHATGFFMCAGDPMAVASLRISYTNS
jgi:hypothetical protein